MKGQLFFDIYHALLPLLNPHSQSKFTSLNKKFHSLSLALAKNQDVLKDSSFYGLLIPTFFFIKTKYDFDWALENASFGGHTKLCHFLIQAGATTFDWALANAAYGGHTYLCYFLY